MILLLAGCLAGVPGSDASPQKIDPSQNISDAFIISDDTLLVNKTFESDRGVPSFVDCHSAGVDAVFIHLEQQIDDELNGISVGISSDTGNMTMFVSRETTRGRTATDTTQTPTIISKPSVSYQRLKAVVPSDASITITHEDGTLSCQGPIAVQNVTSGLD